MQFLKFKKISLIMKVDFSNFIDINKFQIGFGSSGVK
jgi:hypothetical protein